MYCASRASSKRDPAGDSAPRSAATCSGVRSATSCGSLNRALTRSGTVCVGMCVGTHVRRAVLVPVESGRLQRIYEPPLVDGQVGRPAPTRVCAQACARACGDCPRKSDEGPLGVSGEAGYAERASACWCHTATGVWASRAAGLKLRAAAKALLWARHGVR